MQAQSSRAITAAFAGVAVLHGAVDPAGLLAEAVDSAAAVELAGAGAGAGTMLAFCADSCSSRRWRRSFALSLHSKQMAVIHPASPIDVGGAVLWPCDTGWTSGRAAATALSTTERRTEGRVERKLFEPPDRRPARCPAGEWRASVSCSFVALRSGTASGRGAASSARVAPGRPPGAAALRRYAGAARARSADREVAAPGAAIDECASLGRARALRWPMPARKALYPSPGTATTWRLAALRRTATHERDAARTPKQAMD